LDYWDPAPDVTSDADDPYFLALLNSPRCNKASAQFQKHRREHWFFNRAAKTKLHSILHVPIFSFSTIRDCFADIPLPAWHFLYHQPIDPSQLVPWVRKTPTLFWRGSTTGSEMRSASVTSLSHRARFVDHARHLKAIFFRRRKNKPIYVNVGFTSYNELEKFPKEAAKFKAKFPKANYVNLEDQLKNKYLMMLDGWSFNERLYRLASSGSLLFRANLFEEWYEHLLQPGVHYIPINLDYSNLREKLEWASDNDDEARKIAENARTLAIKYLNPNFFKCYAARMLMEYSSLFH
jgi:hypothetical protein